MDRLSKEQLRPSVTTHLVPLLSAAQHLWMGCWTKASFSYLGNCWQSRLTKLPGTPRFRTHKNRVTLLKSSLVMFSIRRRLFWKDLHMTPPARCLRSETSHSAELKPSLISSGTPWMVMAEHPSLKWVSHSRGQARTAGCMKSFPSQRIQSQALGSLPK